MTRIKILRFTVLSGLISLGSMVSTHALAETSDEAIAATQDFFAKMSAENLPGVAAYVPAQGFSEILPESDKLLQLDIKAFEALFKSGRKIDLKVVDLQAQAIGEAAIVTGKRVGSIAAPGTPAVEGRLAFTMIWSKAGGGWQLKHLHLSALPVSK